MHPHIILSSKPASPSSPRQPLPCCTAFRKKLSTWWRRHLRPCNYSLPQQAQTWRTLPANEYGTTRRPPVADPGPPPLVTAAGWALAAMVAFNLLRTVVLLWIRSQPRRTSQPPVAAPPPPPPPAAAASAAVGSGSASGAVAAGASSSSDASSGPPASSAQASEPLPPDLAAATSAPAPARPSVSASAGNASDGVATEQAGGGGGSGGGGGDGRSLRVASYQMRPRGSKSVSNLGRVVICATLDPAPEPTFGPGPGLGSGFGFRSGVGSSAVAAAVAAAQGAPWGTVEWHRRFWEPLISKYADAPEDRVTGLLLVYGRSVLHILEGDNNQLFALLRELQPDDVGAHRLTQIRVPSYILDVRERLFDQWLCATAHTPAGRHSAQRTASIKAAATAAPPAAAAGPQDFPRLASSPDAVFGSTRAAPGPTPQRPPPEQQLVGRIQQLELFVKFVGPKLSALATTESREHALQNLHDYETTTPSEDAVTSLAADLMVPQLYDFVEAFDADYRRYVSLLAMVSELEEQLAAVEVAAAANDESGAAAATRARVVARAASLAGEIRHLARFYDEHVKRDLKAAISLREEERRIRGPNDIARRLAAGMRLAVAPL